MRKIIILVGAPGSGKSTQASFLSQTFLIPHLSTGNILREIAKKNYPNSPMVKEYLQKGKLIPNHDMIQIINAECNAKNCRSGFVLDGYPRNVEQFEYFLTVFQKEHIYMLFFEINFLYLKKRILGRYYCARCSVIYNNNYRKPSVSGVCDFCGNTEFRFREDDNESILQKRFDDYMSVSKQLMKFCQNEVTCHIIDAEQTSEEISKKIYRLIS